MPRSPDTGAATAARGWVRLAVRRLPHRHARHLGQERRRHLVDRIERCERSPGRARRRTTPRACMVLVPRAAGRCDRGMKFGPDKDQCLGAVVRVRKAPRPGISMLANKPMRAWSLGLGGRLAIDEQGLRCADAGCAAEAILLDLFVAGAEDELPHGCRRQSAERRCQSLR